MLFHHINSMLNALTHTLTHSFIRSHMHISRRRFKFEYKIVPNFITYNPKSIDMIISFDMRMHCGLNHLEKRLKNGNFTLNPSEIYTSIDRLL